MALNKLLSYSLIKTLLQHIEMKKYDAGMIKIRCENRKESEGVNTLVP